MLRITPLLASALLLATVSTARAADHCASAEGALCATGGAASEIIARPLRARSFGTSNASRPTPLDPYQGLSATAFPLARVGFFVQSESFSLSRRSSLYDVQGGAVLRLDAGMALTASYRVLGVDLGYDSDIQAADVQPGIAAPFVGIVFDF